jgi:hypothetical protein
LSNRSKKERKRQEARNRGTGQTDKERENGSAAKMETVKSVVSEDKSYQQRQEGRDRIKVSLEAATFVVVVIYAALTYWLLNTSETQLANSERAWVGTCDIGLGIGPMTIKNGHSTREFTAEIAYEAENLSEAD